MNVIHRSIVLLGLTSLTAGGCANISPGKTEAIQPVTLATEPHVGQAYLFRGFIGVFSTGMNSLGDELNAQGVHATVFQADQWDTVADTIAARYKNTVDPEPVVLVGHSYGADNIVRIAQRIKNKGVKIDLLVTLDPVTPPKVPADVKQVVNLYQSNGVLDTLPWLRGIPLEQETPNAVALHNENIRTDRTDLLAPGLNHFNIEKQPKIHAEIIKVVEQVCVSRQQWAAAHQSMPAMTLQVNATAQRTPTTLPVQAARLD